MTEFEWTRLLGTSDTDNATALTTGSDGSIYIVGSTNGDLDGQTNNGAYDAFLTKFNPDGSKDWTRLLGTSVADVAYALTTGADGSIYVAGVTRGDLDGQTNDGGFGDAFISKFNPDGTQGWTKLLGTSGIDEAKVLTTGTDGSIYIAGHTSGGDLDGQTFNGGHNDAFISKFNPDGTQNWTRLLGSSDVDYAHALTTGADGSIYIAGETLGDLDGQTNNAGSDAFPSLPSIKSFISKFNPDGTKDWTRILGTSVASVADYIAGTQAYALTTGTDGSIYIAGDTNTDLDGQTNHGEIDAFISQFNPDGTKGWTRLFGTSSFDSAKSLTTGEDGSIYIAGDTNTDLDGQTNHGEIDAFISQFNPDGTKGWTRLFGTSSFDSAKSLTTGEDGSIYFAGTTNGDLDDQTNNGDRDAFIRKLIELDESVATIAATSVSDNLESTSSNDSIDGGEGIDTVAFTGNFSSYSFTRGTDTLEISDQRTTGTTDGTDTLKNVEYIKFTDQTVEASKVDVVKTYSGNFSDYKFYNKGNGVYQIKTDSGYDDITGLPLLTFTGEATTSSFRDISAIADIKGTFDQITGLNTDDAKMFRLYNASFKRLPDPDGLKYWIGKYSSGENDERAVASSFLVSAEFQQRYGANVSDTTYVNNLYQNVLGRLPDSSGLNYWLGQLNNGAETRYEVLLGFAESAENKNLFADMTGFA